MITLVPDGQVVVGFLPALIAAGGSLLGGILGSKKEEKSANLDRQTQLDIAKNSISWRAEDAKRAGIHPLAALGAGYPSYTPVGDGGSGSTLAGSISDAGREFAKGMDRKQRELLDSEIYVNKAQAAMYEAQATTELSRLRAATQGRTLGAVNMGDPVAFAATGEGGSIGSPKIDLSQPPSAAQVLGDAGPLMSRAITTSGQPVAVPNPNNQMDFDSWLTTLIVDGNLGKGISDALKANLPAETYQFLYNLTHMDQVFTKMVPAEARRLIKKARAATAGGVRKPAKGWLEKKYGKGHY